jgi:OOP family OmpA-OmpF porin
MTLTRTLNTLGLVAISALAVPCATADDYDVRNDSMWYIGANVGQSRARIDDARILGSGFFNGATSVAINNDDRHVGYKLYGGYQFNKYLALEGGYFDLGRFGYTVTTVPAGTLHGETRIRGANLDVLGMLPIFDRFSAFARVGVNYARAKDSFTSSGFVNVANSNPSENGTNYKFGLGLQYQITDSLAMRLEGERYRVKDGIGNKGDIDLYSVGLIYQFGEKTHARPRPAPAPAQVAVIESAPVTPTSRTVTFSADALFAFDKSDLKPGGKHALDEFIRELQGVSFEHIMVTGHTDRIGTHHYNMALSNRRAHTVKHYLSEHGGIPSHKINAVGVDGKDPVTKPHECPGHRVTPALKACLQPDRRVDVVVHGMK